MLVTCIRKRFRWSIFIASSYSTYLLQWLINKLPVLNERMKLRVNQFIIANNSRKRFLYLRFDFNNYKAKKKMIILHYSVQQLKQLAIDAKVNILVNSLMELGYHWNWCLHDTKIKMAAYYIGTYQTSKLGVINNIFWPHVIFMYKILLLK